MSSRNVSRPALWAVFVLAAVIFTSPAIAQKWVFVTVDFGAEFEPRQLHDQLFVTANQDPNVDMIAIEERDAMFRERFPELTLPSVGGTKSKLDRGYDAYMNSGDFEKAQEEFEKGLPEAYKMTDALSLRPEFAKLTFDAAIAMAIIHSINADVEGLRLVLQNLVRYFPARPLDENEVPPDIVEAYKSILQEDAGNRFAVSVAVGSGCKAHMNGIELDGKSVKVLPGKYGVTEVCDGNTTRAYILDVKGDMAVDFTGRFSQLWEYPQSLSLKGKDIVSQPDVLGGVLAELGQRIGASTVLAAGLVPPAGEKPETYYIFMVDVATSKITGSLEVRPGEVSTPERMQEAFTSVVTGSEFEHDEPLGPAGTNWMLIGGITVGVGGLVTIGGIVLGVLANGAQDDFNTCNASIECIGRRGEREDFISTRNSFALGADIMYITGGVIIAGGVTLIVLDLMGVFDGGGSSEADTSAERPWNLSISPTQGGGYVELEMRF